MKNVLLIEPNTSLAQTYAKALQYAGCQVAHTTNAQDAVDIADKNAPDLIILELQLAAHSGVEFLHEFRSYTEWQNVPVIVNTAIPPTHTAPIKNVLVKELGVRAVLYKPRTTLKELLREVREQLE